MYRLRLLLLASVACLVVAEDVPMTTPDSSPSTSDSPETTSDTTTFTDSTTGSSIEPVTDEHVSSTESTNTTASPSAPSTTPEPSSATSVGVWSAASLTLLAIAIMS